MNELVSIIIPTYKRSEFLIYAIESVLKQSYSNIELIIVDNNVLNSADQRETRDVVLGYQDERIKYIVSVVSGNGAAARNLGVQSSKGKYIGFLDDDDYFMENKIKFQVEQMKSLECGICLSGFTRVSFGNRRKESYILNLENIYTELLAMSTDLCAGSTLLIEKDIFISIGGFDEAFERHQDIEVLIRLLEKTKICTIDGDYTVIREHALSNHPISLRKIITNREIFIEKFKYAIKNETEENKRKIYYNQNLYLSIQSLKYFQIKLFLIYFFKTKNISSATRFIFIELYTQLRKRVRKNGK